MTYRNRHARVIKGEKDHMGKVGVIIQEPLGNSRYVVVRFSSGLALLISLDNLELQESDSVRET